MNSMSLYFENKKDVVECVSETLSLLRHDSASTMTITPEPYAAYSVRIVTEGSLEDIGKTLEQTFSYPHTNTSPENTQDG